MKQNDVYQKEVERLLAIPDAEFKEKILEAWEIGNNHSPLFDVLGTYSSMHSASAGCLTQIKDGYPVGYKAFINMFPDEELSSMIAKDERIPGSSTEITKESLPVFAQYQRLYQERLSEAVQ